MVSQLKIYKDAPSGLPTRTSDASDAERREGEKLLWEATFSRSDDPVFDVPNIPSPRPDESGTVSAPEAGRRGNLNLSPLTPEQALRAFMQVDPKRVAERERREREEARKRRKGKATPPSEADEDEEDIADSLEALKEPGGTRWADIKSKYGL